MPRKVLIGIVLLFLPVLLLIGVNALFANVARREYTEQALVRIAANHCQGDPTVLCTVTEFGSGVIIDDRGIILTSYEIVSGPLGYADDFEITLSNGTTRTYRADRIAVEPEKGLALLLIYYDSQEQSVINKDLSWVDPAIKFSTLPFSDQLVENGSEVEVLWWPAKESTSVTATVNGATITLPIAFVDGMSGTPVLRQNQVVGIILGAFNENTTRVRSGAEIRSLLWQTTTQQVWVEDIQVASHGITETTSVQITATIHALDQIAKPLAFLAYVFDENRQPLSNQTIDSEPIASNKIYTPQHFADIQSVVLTQSLASVNIDRTKLRLRFLVWDIDGERVLWRDNGWYRIIESLPITPNTPPAPVTPTMPLTPTRPSLECLEENMAPVNDEFCMDIHEVTNAEYATYTDDCLNCSPPMATDTRYYRPYYGDDDFDNYPVVSVTWSQADEYCRNFDKLLPTAEQWRQAESMVKNRSDVITQVIAFTDTMPVMSNQYDKSTGAIGIYDLIGNVREWTGDKPVNTENLRKVMGFSHQNVLLPPESELLSSHRIDLGFRCVK